MPKNDVREETVINVDTGSSAVRPDDSRVERGRVWQMTWIAVAMLVLLILLFVGFTRYGDQSPGDSGLDLPERSEPAPGPAVPPGTPGPVATP